MIVGKANNTSTTNDSNAPNKALGKPNLVEKYQKMINTTPTVKPALTLSETKPLIRPMKLSYLQKLDLTALAASPFETMNLSSAPMSHNAEDFF